MLRKTAGILLLTVTTAAQADMVDQRDPRVEQGLYQLQNALSAIRAAEEYVLKAHKLEPVEGFNYERLGYHLKLLKEELDFLLTPQRRREKYKTLTPDSMMFTEPDGSSVPYLEGPPTRREQAPAYRAPRSTPNRRTTGGGNGMPSPSQSASPSPAATSDSTSSTSESNTGSGMQPDQVELSDDLKSILDENEGVPK